MSGLFDDSNRQVVPRWYPLRTAAALGDLEPYDTGKGRLISAHDLQIERSRQDWRSFPLAVFGGDLLARALQLEAFDDLDAIAAATHIIRPGTASPEPLQNLAQYFLSRHSDSLSRNADLVSYNDLAASVRIKQLRATARSYPRNAFIWSELAYAYAIVGLKDKAQRAMTTAVAISPNNRFVLRSAARCFMHYGDPEQALAYLRRTNRTANDPWLIAAEISVAESVGKTSRFAQQGRRILKAQHLPSLATSDLASAVATLEAKNGRLPVAKRFLKQSLNKPTENAFAQAEWLTKATGGAIVVPEITTAADYEARARRAFRIGEFREAVHAATCWMQFQPFSTRPVVFATYAASVCMDDHATAVDIVAQAAQDLRRDPIIANNYAFALASLDRPLDAEAALANADHDAMRPEDEITHRVTRGLIAFRRGQIDAGRLAYEESIVRFGETRNLRGKAIAEVFLAREELRCRSSRAADCAARAVVSVKRAGVAELLGFAERQLQETREVITART